MAPRVSKRTGKPTRAYRRSRLGVRSGYRRRILYNPRPVFTETYRAQNITLTQNPTTGEAESPFALSATMDGISQLSQYSNLYTKYKVIKCQWLFLPTWTGGENQNAAIYNASSGPTVPPGLTSVGTTRIVYSMVDSPVSGAFTGPASEQLALMDNGCKIKFLSKLLKINNRPVPATKDSNGVEMTFNRRFINFSSSGPNTPHYGVQGFITQPQSVGATGSSQITIAVYCKLTFQLADPK